MILCGGARAGCFLALQLPRAGKLVEPHTKELRDRPGSSYLLLFDPRSLILIATPYKAAGRAAGRRLYLCLLECGTAGGLRSVAHNAQTPFATPARR